MHKLKAIALLALILGPCGLSGCSNPPSDDVPSMSSSLEDIAREEERLNEMQRRRRLVQPMDVNNIPRTGTFNVQFECTCGDFVVEVRRDWAPIGAQRFHDLVSSQFYDECRFFRVVDDFVIQWGINGDPETHAYWNTKIPDDPVEVSNKRGYITYATSGRNTRTSQVFISLRDNAPLDDQGFSPFGRVIKGMSVVEAINGEYGERPQQGSIEGQGNAYLNSKFPRLDYIRKATIISESDE